MKYKANICRDFGTSSDEFKQYVGREPRNKKEFDDWVHYVEKGVEAQLDWNIIGKCAAENFDAEDLK